MVSRWNYEDYVIVGESVESGTYDNIIDSLNEDDAAVVTSPGDIVYAGGLNLGTRLPIGPEYAILRSNSDGSLRWIRPSLSSASTEVDVSFGRFKNYLELPRINTVDSVNVSEATNESITLRVLVNRLGGGAFQIYYRHRRSSGQAWTSRSTSASSTSVDITISGLEESTRYTVEVSLDSDYSTSVSVEALTILQVSVTNGFSLYTPEWWDDVVSVDYYEGNVYVLTTGGGVVVYHGESGLVLHSRYIYLLRGRSSSDIAAMWIDSAAGKLYYIQDNSIRRWDLNNESFDVYNVTLSATFNISSACSDGTYVYTYDTNAAVIRVYDLSTGTRNTGREISVGRGRSGGMFTDGSYIWIINVRVVGGQVVNSTIFNAYNLNTRASVSTFDYTLYDDYRINMAACTEFNGDIYYCFTDNRVNLFDHGGYTLCERYNHRSNVIDTAFRFNLNQSNIKDWAYIDANGLGYTTNTGSSDDENVGYLGCVDLNFNVFDPREFVSLRTYGNSVSDIPNALIYRDYNITVLRHVRNVVTYDIYDTESKTLLAQWRREGGSARQEKVSQFVTDGATYWVRTTGSETLMAYEVDDSDFVRVSSRDISFGVPSGFQVSTSNLSDDLAIVSDGTVVWVVWRGIGTSVSKVLFTAYSLSNGARVNGRDFTLNNFELIEPDSGQAVRVMGDILLIRGRSHILRSSREGGRYWGNVQWRAYNLVDGSRNPEYDLAVDDYSTRPRVHFVLFNGTEFAGISGEVVSDTSSNITYVCNINTGQLLYRSSYYRYLSQAGERSASIINIRVDGNGVYGLTTDAYVNITLFSNDLDSHETIERLNYGLSPFDVRPYSLYIDDEYYWVGVSLERRTSPNRTGSIFRAPRVNNIDYPRTVTATPFGSGGGTSTNIRTYATNGSTLWVYAPEVSAQNLSAYTWPPSGSRLAAQDISLSLPSVGTYTPVVHGFFVNNEDMYIYYGGRESSLDGKQNMYIARVDVP